MPEKFANPNADSYAITGLQGITGITDKDWKEGRLPNYGIKLSPTFTWQSNGSFYSSDYLDDPAKRPKLVIETID